MEGQQLAVSNLQQLQLAAIFKFLNGRSTVPGGC